MLRIFFRKLLQLSHSSPHLNPLAGTTTLSLAASILLKPPISSCGLSSKPDLSPSPLVKSESVLRMLRSYDISDESSIAIVTKFPKLHTINPEKTLKPKLDFLRSDGFTGVELAEILLANPFLLRKNLERSIASSVNFLKAILPCKKTVIRVLKSTNMLLTPKQEANIKILKDHGVPDAMILKLLLFQPRSLARSTDRFVADVENVKELGLAPASSAFVIALGVMSYMSRSTFLRKVELYRELGWSEKEIFDMFKKQPACLNISDESIRKKMGYFRETIGWGPEFLTTNPVFLMMSLEKRIIPRCAVLNVLMSRGLIEKNTRAPSKFQTKESSFFEKYVKKYEEKAPEVVRAYQGKINFQGWEWLKDEKEKQRAR